MEAAISDGRRRRRVTDERILIAAVAEFAERGRDGASLVSIAARAGTTRPTLYANFGSKDELYAVAVQAEAQALRDLLLETYHAVEGDRPETQLRRGSQAFFDFAATHPEGFRLLFAGRVDVPQDDVALRAVHEEVAAAVTAMIRPLVRGRGAGERARGMAVMTIGLLVAAARDAIARGDDLSGIADLALEFLSTAFAGMTRA